jgi:tripartite-type tricarboxylate transporter receptor subunit TctC
MKRAGLVIAVLLAGVLSCGWAQDYSWQPDGPVNIIVPWAAGGSTDQVVRILAAEIEDALGQSVVVVNQPGASGSIGTKNALEARLDGHTWASGAASDLGTYVILDMLDTKLADWHLYLAVANASVVGVNPGSPYQTFADLLAAMEANPGKITVATAGLSSAGHNAIELLAQEAGFSYSHVTYDGGNPAVIATVSGETQVTTQLAVEQAEMIRGKRIRPLAVLSASPLSIEGYGDIPPVTNWLPDLQVHDNYFGIWIPVGAPAEVVDTMNRIWAERISGSEVLRNYAVERGALFGPSYGEEAQQRASAMVRSQAWTLFDSGKAPVSPDSIGIDRP